MKSDVIHCKNCDIIALDGKVVETKPESYMKFFRGNSVINELVEKVLNLREYVTNNFKDAQKVLVEEIRKRAEPYGSGPTGQLGYIVSFDLLNEIEKGESQ